MPATPSTPQPISSAARKLPSDLTIGLILAFVLAVPPLRAQAAGEPPSNLAKLVAHQETETHAERNEYMYRQTVTIQELDDRGTAHGEYKEVRDIIFSPTHERTEELIGRPNYGLQLLQMTEEDFRDIREVQPFLFSTDQLWAYETRFKGEETVDGVECYVLQVRPQQILDGQRLFDGLLWASKEDYSIVRTVGKAVPDIRSMKAENLFPHFTTLWEPVEGGFRFPVHTYSDDTLDFRTGPLRTRMDIRYADYKRFGANSAIRYEKPE